MDLRIYGAQPQKRVGKMLNGPSTGKLVSGTKATVMKSKAWRHIQHLILAGSPTNYYPFLCSPGHRTVTENTVS